jgi:hypothetical protein
MSDYSSELPVRSQLPGQVSPDDIIVKIGDATNPTTQLLGVDASGRIVVKLDDGVGNAINSQSLSATQWLQVVDPANGPASPGTAAVFSELVGGIYNSTLPTLTSGQQASLQLDSSGRLIVSTHTNNDTNYGVVGTNTLRTAAQIGNATGAADFNYGTVGAQTLRTASQIGNATGAADFNAGATGAQTLRVTANQGTPNTAANAWPTYLTSGGVANSPTNPIFVSEADIPGTAVDFYTDSVAVAKAATATIDYTVTAGKTFYTKQHYASASGLIKLEVKYETAAGSGTFNTFWVGFNSSATPAILIPTPTNKSEVAGARIRYIVTNLDKGAMDIYTTLSGIEQ